jgi:hypothetical protein
MNGRRDLLCITMAAALALVSIPTAGQSPLASASAATAQTCDTDVTEVKLGRADTTMWESSQGHGSLTSREMVWPGDPNDSPMVDVLAGDEVPLTLTSSDGVRPKMASLVALLVLEGHEPVWLGPYGSDHPALTIPAGVVGNGVIHVLAGACDGWRYAATWAITIADPATAARCPTDVEGLHAWFDASDQRILVGRTPIDSMGPRGGIISRYDPLVRDDQAGYVGYELTPQRRSIRLQAGERFSVRARDRSVDVLAVWAGFTGRLSTRELRSGFARELPEPSIDGRARLDGLGGFTVLAPRKPGRYMLVMNPKWRTPCLTTQDAQSVLSVVVR